MREIDELTGLGPQQPPVKTFAQIKKEATALTAVQVPTTEVSLQRIEVQLRTLCAILARLEKRMNPVVSDGPDQDAPF